MTDLSLDARGLRSFVTQGYAVVPGLIGPELRAAAWLRSTGWLPKLHQPRKNRTTLLLPATAAAGLAVRRFVECQPTGQVGRGNDRAAPA